MMETERLVIREWRDDDVAAYAAMCADPNVMAHLGGSADRAAVIAGMDGRRADQARLGHCFWALERAADGAFLGFCGLEVVDIAGAPIDGDVEIGWRLARNAWGQGYAREAADACLAWAWQQLAVPRVIAITVPANVRSWSLMERLGMTRRSDLDFGHPLFTPRHPLHRHISYAVERPA